jgi:hypothetical protein
MAEEKNPVKKVLLFRQNVLFLPLLRNMVVLAQLVRASDCGSEGRGFEPHIPPKKAGFYRLFFMHFSLLLSC